DEVLCPSLTFVATAAAVVHCGAKPVLVDICSAKDPTMDPFDAEKKITARTKAILPVHYGGIPANMRTLTNIAKSHNLWIVEDAAHAPGARYDGRACGSWSDAGCFSFFGNKNITTAEGGMITTSDPELAAHIRLLRSHGMTVNSWDRENGRPGHYDVMEFGFNFRFDDIRAAIGLAQLAKLERINLKRKELSRLYSVLLSESEPDLILPFASIPLDKEPSYHLYPVLFPTTEERNSMEELLRKDGIQTSIHYKPIHRFKAFQDVDSSISLPVTENFAERELSLPLYPSMTESHVESVVSAVNHCRARSASTIQARFMS
ncbi:MAG TPA: DegT/DnrJ/EryC1/StrS family aminotransferase, partial [Terriglobia bacterium]|nr:DegT/DnrJ/EryC1/StrS family aminotransferase [Terriglobia bacterium]